jgi:IPT/TIG domain
VTGDFTSAPLRDSDPWTGARLQQGRVLLDGDWNLNIDAAARDRQRLARDTIGRAGVPQGSSNFVISFAADGTLQIGAGSMWIGGLYAVNPATLDYTAQESIAPLPASGQALLYLDAFVQEVQAAEDPGDLLDPALDGIDTTTRTRVAWRVRAASVQATTCTDAASALPAELVSTGRLDIELTTPSTPADPCAPPDDPRGKLPDGLLRVEVLDTGSETTARFAWSYEDGAAAVAATVAGNSVTLAPSPSVTFFQNDLVEVSTLQRRADRLANGPLFSVANVQPGAAGSVVTLSAPSAVTGAPSGLCLRRWDGQAAGAATSVAATLGGADVGIAFTARPGTYLAGDWWVTRVRGSSADSVDTLTAAAPDGTQHYVAPLAVVDLTAKTVLSDCRPQFPQLTGLQGGCCTVEVQPSDVSGGASLPALMAAYANRGPVTFCLAPGTYTLSEPLVLGSALNGVTLQGCSGGVVLQGPPRPGPGFTLGLIVLQGASPVTVRGVELSVPLVGFAPASDAFQGLPTANQTLLQAFATGLQVAIGISASDSAGLLVEDCTFSFPDPGSANVFGAGIYATGAMDGVEITRCTFQSANPPSTAPFYDLAAGNQTEPPYQATFGYLQVAILADPSTSTAGSTRTAATAAESAGVHATAGNISGADTTREAVDIPQGQLQETTAAARATAGEDTGIASTGIASTGTSQLLQDFAIERCQFQGLTLPMFAMTQLGTLRIDQNTVRNSYGGFWLYSITDSSQLILFDKLAIGTPEIFTSFGGLGAAALCDRIAPIATALARVLPTTPPISGSLVPRRITAPSAAELARAQQFFTNYYARARGSGAASEAVPAGAAQAPEPAAAAPEPAAAAPERAAEAVVLPTVLSTIFALPTGAAEVVIPPADTGTSVSLRLDLADCQVDAVIADSYSGAALIIADLTQDPIFPSGAAPGAAVASAVVHGNRLRSRFPLGETALGFALAEANVTGNIIANEQAVPAQPSQTLPESWSLSLFQMAQPLGAPAVIVSGNIFIDPPDLPLPNQTWQPLNTVIGYSVVPAVTGITPPSGSAGNQVTITGTGFTAATKVSFVSTASTATAANTVESDTQILATVPPGSGTVDVTVTTPAGTSATSAADQFTYVQPGRIAPAAQPRAATVQNAGSPTVPMAVQDTKPPPGAT